MSAELERAVSEGRILEAAQIAKRLRMGVRAGQLFEQAGEYLEAAKSYRESGQGAQALAAAMRIDRDAPNYPTAARVVIGIAAAMRLIRQDVEDFLAPFLNEDPSTGEDRDAMFLLGQLYEYREYTNHALALFRRIARSDPRHQAAAYLRMAESSAQQNLTAEVSASAADMRAVRKMMQGHSTPPPVVVNAAPAVSAPTPAGRAPAANAPGPSAQAPARVGAPLPPAPTSPRAGAPAGPSAGLPAGPARAQAVASPAVPSAPMSGRVPAAAVVSSGLPPPPQSGRVPAQGAPMSGPAHTAQPITPGPVSAEVPVSRAIVPGTMLARRYRVEALLGTGATATVYRVEDTELGDRVALKLFDAQNDANIAARFRREVSLARKLMHPNIVRIYDLGDHEGQRFLTMELMQGQDLRSLLDKTPLSVRQKRDLLLQALEGLGHAHTNQVVHRDVKPENLFVTTKDVLKVADFGFAKQFGASSITMAGSMGGTPYYMSPEQITDLRSADHRSDLYALGAVAYEMFTGRVLFECEGLTQLLLMHLERMPEPMRSLSPDLPAELDDIVLKLLAKQREQRFQSCAEVAEALRAVRI